MLDLDLSGVVEQGAPLPDGAYSVIVDKAEVSPTKSGGKMIKVNLKVIDGPFMGRVLFESFNYENANPTAVQIGLGQLKGMMKAFGHTNPNRLTSTQELIGLKGMVTTKIEENPGYSAQAKVKSYKPLLASVAAPNAAVATGAASPF